MDELLHLTAQMAREGIRRLLVLSGEDAWTLSQAQMLRTELSGDGLWVGPQRMPEPYASPAALNSLLGREFQHAFFDARDGFDVAAFAALAGTLRAGSWLVLLTPDFGHWITRPDADSLRWSDSPVPVPTPNFVYRFCQQIIADKESLLWRQGHEPAVPDFPVREQWYPADGHPQAEQAAILAELADFPPGIAALTAERGRGKSALAGMLIRQMAGDAIVTAPARGATEVMTAFAGEGFRFIAPDALLASECKATWLIVDEAAAIPGPLLRQLVSRFPRTLLTTTVQGYEGTGRGFLLKFCASFAHLRQFSLTTPIRWAAGCPLEVAIAQLLLFNDETFQHAPTGEVALESVSQESWRRPALPEAMYQLLSGAHYRTSPLDLRRMMDAPGQHFTCARSGKRIAGALWLVEEGGLEPLLSQAVWAGYRRPRGNLVAQSLAAHGGSPLGATLTGQRISRIAVHPARQREGLGQRLVVWAASQAADRDYLSVSFGYTPELWRFWQSCGFTLVRLGTHREASSGCYTAMALYPITEAGRHLAQREAKRLQRDEYWLRAWRDEPSPLTTPEEATIFTEEDWLEVAGFAYAHRPLLVVAGSLNRLLKQVDLALPALRARLQQHDETELCRVLRLSGRKALLVRLREEATQALSSMDADRASVLRQQVEMLQFF